MEENKEQSLKVRYKIKKITLIICSFCFILLGIVLVGNGIYSLISGQVIDSVDLLLVVFSVGLGITVLYIQLKVSGQIRIRFKNFDVWKQNLPTVEETKEQNKQIKSRLSKIILGIIIAIILFWAICFILTEPGILK